MFRAFCIFLCCVSFALSAEKKSICLNMIVKNESKVIERCLNSVKPIIDHWVIVDTGSEDGTQEIIKKCMKDIPGELCEKPWVNFEHNRNEALKLTEGKGDFVLFIDADEEFQYDENFKMPNLDMDAYFISFDFHSTRYYRLLLVDNRFDWKWVGVLQGVTNFIRAEGCRSQDPEKFKKDAKILEKALEKEPDNARYVFYLAQSYKDAGEYELAMKNYRKRVEMKGWDQEVFWSLYQVACLQEQLQRPMEEVVKGYTDAFLYRPSRAEPLCKLATYFRQQGNNLLGYAAANMGALIPKPDDILMLEEWVYDYWLTYEKAFNGCCIGKFEESIMLANELLESSKLPEDMRFYVEDVVKWAQPHIKQMKAVK